MRGATVEVPCKCCQQPFTARVADRNRGWGLYCSKSCKASGQFLPARKPARAEKPKPIKQPPAWVRRVFNGGVFKPTLRDQYEMHDAAMDSMEAGWDGHK